MTFLEFHRYEVDAAIYVSPWEKWVGRVEQILGHDIDGDQLRDGYSLDYALYAYESGVASEDYAAGIIAHRANLCAGCGHPETNCHCQES